MRSPPGGPGGDECDDDVGRGRANDAYCVDDRIGLIVRLVSVSGRESLVPVVQRIVTANGSRTARPSKLPRAAADKAQFVNAIASTHTRHATTNPPRLASLAACAHVPSAREKRVILSLIVWPLG